MFVFIHFLKISSLFIFWYFTNYINAYKHPINFSYIKKSNVKIMYPSKQITEKNLYQDLNSTYSDGSSEIINPVLFFTGGSNFIPNEVYTNFLYNFASSNFTLFLTNYQKSNEFKNLIQYIKNNTNQKIMLVGHSSCVKLSIDLSNNFDSINRIVFLDPVDNRLAAKDILLNLFKIRNIIKFKNITDLLIINARKSFQGSINPISIPFIPVLSLDENNVELGSSKSDKVIINTFNDHGHTDILDLPWSNFMHNNNICKGSNYREYHNINNYHQQIVDIIKNFYYLD
tara:strand:- start:1728 stop:2585 length:858 start_codon:yes stop_codon:yes gene_type:complete